MDFCVDCGSLLRDNVCGRCHIIYAYEFKDNFCINCGHKMLKSIDLVRYRCEFCNYNYFFTKHYRDDQKEIDEFLRYYSLTCRECGSEVKYFEQTGEMVCIGCGIVYDDPIVCACEPEINNDNEIVSNDTPVEYIKIENIGIDDVHTHELENLEFELENLEFENLELDNI